MTNSIHKHITLNQSNVDILDDIIENTKTINNYSAAIRYVIYKYNESNNKDSSDTKLNTLAKNMEIALELIACGFHEQGITAINSKEESYIFEEAKRNVENKIQKSVTKNSMSKPMQSRQPSLKLNF